MSEYMYHPKGGWLNLACKSHSKAELEKLGWVERDIHEFIRNKTAPAVPEPEKKSHEKSLAEQYLEKFGKLPHHRMKEENIKAALLE